MPPEALASADPPRAGARHVVENTTSAPSFRTSYGARVDTLAQLQEVLNEGADVVLLDNMSPAQLREAVALIGGRIKAEASGGIHLGGVREVAKQGWT